MKRLRLNLRPASNPPFCGSARSNLGTINDCFVPNLGRRRNRCRFVVTRAQSCSGFIAILDLVNLMTIRTKSLTELLTIFPGDATVRGFENGLTVKNADGSGEVVMLNDNFQVPDAAEKDRSDPTPSDRVNRTKPARNYLPSALTTAQPCVTKIQMTKQSAEPRIRQRPRRNDHSA
jgi:hypothetical protein